MRSSLTSQAAGFFWSIRQAKKETSQSTTISPAVMQSNRARASCYGGTPRTSRRK